MNRIDLQVARHRLEGIAEEMGEVLRRTAFSPNIKERRDYSCAITDTNGNVISQAAHIPVHLGAVSITMQHFLDEVEPEPQMGYLLNDPYAGGTHLPDISFLYPWTVDETIAGWVINRAHHTDIGGAEAGSMSVTEHIDDEGFRTGPRIVYRDNELLEDSIDGLLKASRTPEQRITDLEAQIAAGLRGIERLRDWNQAHSRSCKSVFNTLRDYSESFTRKLLDQLPDKTVTCSDVMDGDGLGSGPVQIHVKLTVDGDRITVDFRHSDDQVQGNINCPRAVTVSSVYYVIQCLLDSEVPINSGIYEPVDILTRSGSLLDVEYPGAVAGGNVETSQRIVDVLLKALAKILPDRIPAASQGTMNNITFGYESEDGFKTYYETLGGGSGGGPDHGGLSARQVHMTNTLNTPIEEFERSFPLEVSRLKIRNDSGGSGDNRGGDGLIKSWTALEPVTVSLLTERRLNAPYGLWGASSGKKGINYYVSGNDPETLESKTTIQLTQGDQLVMKTPGGGGWNQPGPEID